MKGRLASPRLALICAVLAFVLGIPTLFVGFAADDYVHRTFLHDHGIGPYPIHWAKLFTFVDGDPARTHFLVDRGLMSWWSDPELRLSFCRPFAGATHAFDAWLLWDSPLLQHAHSLLWFALLAWTAAKTYRTLLGPTWVAGLAAIFYLLDPSHGIPIAWLANRNALLAGVFAIGAFGLYVNGRRLASPIVFAFALASGESAVGALVFFAAHAYFLDDRPLSDRVRGLAPLGVVVAIWAVLYRVLGFGVAHSGLYLEPMREPASYLLGAAFHLPLLGATELGAAQPDPYAFFGAQGRLAMLGVALLFLAWATPAFVRTVRADRRARFFLVAGVLSLLPSCATFPSGRLLVIPSFAWLGLLALVVEHATKTRLERSFRMWTLIGHLGLGPFALELSLQQMTFFNRAIHRVAAGLPTGPAVARRRVIVTNAPDPTFTYYSIPIRRAAGDVVPEKMLVLAPGARRVTVRREDERTLLVHVDGGLYRSGTEALTRKGPMPVGWTTELTNVRIEIAGTAPDGVPTDIRFHFDGDLAEDYEWRSWDGLTLVPFVWPAPGETATFDGRLPALF